MATKPAPVVPTTATLMSMAVQPIIDPTARPRVRAPYERVRTLTLVYPGSATVPVLSETIRQAAANGRPYTRIRMTQLRLMALQNSLSAPDATCFMGLPIEIISQAEVDKSRVPSYTGGSKKRKRISC